MKTLLSTNWIDYKTVITIDGQDYEIEANVYLECRNISDPHSVTGKEEKVAASVEGWTALPEISESHPHHQLLDSKIRFEVEEGYNS